MLLIIGSDLDFSAQIERGVEVPKRFHVRADQDHRCYVTCEALGHERLPEPGNLWSGDKETVIAVHFTPDGKAESICPLVRASIEKAQKDLALINAH